MTEKSFAALMANEMFYFYWYDGDRTEHQLAFSSHCYFCCRYERRQSEIVASDDQSYDAGSAAVNFIVGGPDGLYYLVILAVKTRKMKKRAGRTDGKSLKQSMSDCDSGVIFSLFCCFHAKMLNNSTDSG